MSLLPVRALKLILTGLFAAIAVVAGLVIAAIVALTAFTAMLVNRLSSRRQPLPPAARDRSSARPPQDDAIDVTATEIHPAAPAPIEATNLNERFRE
ncbi:MAG: hypothetical protein ABIZ04_13625 [Opitutus sp.]